MGAAPVKWRRFYSAAEAARYAASLAEQWRTEDGEVWDAAELLATMEQAQADGLLDPRRVENYCLVDDEGSLGVTGDAEGHIYWMAYAVRPRTPEPPTVCPGCGGAVRESWRFCRACGRQLKDP